MTQVFASRQHAADQLRMKPSSSPDAQANVFSIGSPVEWRTAIWHCRLEVLICSAILCGAGAPATGRFLLKFQIPQKNGTNGANRPFGPAGKPCVQHCSATCGASRLATAQADGGFMISEPCPEIRNLLFEASSHAATSEGRNFISFL